MLLKIIIKIQFFSHKRKKTKRNKIKIYPKDLKNSLKNHHNKLKKSPNLRVKKIKRLPRKKKKVLQKKRKRAKRKRRRCPRRKILRAKNKKNLKIKRHINTNILNKTLQVGEMPLVIFSCNLTEDQNGKI